MLIRSQDKKILANLNNLSSIFIEESKEKYIVSLSVRKLAAYSTEEKAIKVLDMIEDAYNKCFAFSMGNDGYYHEVRESKVFQIPKDEEV